jgi:hypothetical protein
MPGAKPDKYETGKPSTGRPSFTAFRRRAAVFMSAVSGVRAWRARARGKQGRHGEKLVFSGESNPAEYVEESDSGGGSDRITGGGEIEYI